MKRVLVVAPPTEQREHWVSLLQGAGFLVSTATDAKSALRQMAERPDLMLMDDVPKKGEELCQRIRAFSKVPLIVLCNGSEFTRVAILRSGADTCLPTSVGSAELVARIQRLLLRFRSQTREQTYVD